MTKLQRIARKAVEAAVEAGLVQADDRETINAVAQLAAATAILAAPHAFYDEILDPIYLELRGEE